MDELCRLPDFMQAVEAVGRAEKGVKDSRQVAQHEHAEIYASVRLQSNGL